VSRRWIDELGLSKRRWAGVSAAAAHRSRTPSGCSSCPTTCSRCSRRACLSEGHGRAILQVRDRTAQRSLARRYGRGASRSGRPRSAPARSRRYATALPSRTRPASGARAAGPGRGMPRAGGSAQLSARIRDAPCVLAGRRLHRRDPVRGPAPRRASSCTGSPVRSPPSRSRRARRFALPSLT
jgi:hypothetical protein